ADDLATPLADIVLRPLVAARRSVDAATEGQQLLVDASDQRLRQGVACLQLALCRIQRPSVEQGFENFGSKIPGVVIVAVLSLQLEDLVEGADGSLHPRGDHRLLTP